MDSLLILVITKRETLLEAIRNLMEIMKCSAEQAMAALKIPEADKGKVYGKIIE